MDDILSGVRAAFSVLCAIPHSSGHEAALCGVIARRLQSAGYAPWQDEAGNLFCDLPATPGREGGPLVLLQAHLDMVCAVGRPDYDPLTSPIRPVERDGWLCTDGASSLGADCGAGVAVLLWLAAQRDVPHPPLRLILTVAEETGLVGAQAVPPQALAGGKYLINLDGFRFGRLVTGCAGGLRERFSRPCGDSPVPVTPNGRSYRLALTDFQGGHSGFNIGAGRTNAVLLMGELLRALRTEVPFALADFAGGTAFNAIPYGCTAAVAAIAPARDVLERLGRDLCARNPNEPDGRLVIEEIDPPQTVWDGGAASGLLTLLGGFADGVYARHPSGAVADSSNLGRVYRAQGMLHADAMVRCTDPDAARALHQSHLLVGAMCGFTGEIHSQYPAWPEEADSALIDLLAERYQAHTGREAERTIQHVGLEPALLRDKAPGLACVCIGMDLEGCHSPQERWRLDTVEPFVRMLTDTLAALT